MYIQLYKAHLNEPNVQNQNRFTKLTKPGRGKDFQTIADGSDYLLTIETDYYTGYFCHTSNVILHLQKQDMKRTQTRFGGRRTGVAENVLWGWWRWLSTHNTPPQTWKPLWPLRFSHRSVKSTGRVHNNKRTSNETSRKTDVTSKSRISYSHFIVLANFTRFCPNSIWLRPTNLAHTRL